jgi:hypothetical protein
VKGKSHNRRSRADIMRSYAKSTSTDAKRGWSATKYLRQAYDGAEGAGGQDQFQ